MPWPSSRPASAGASSSLMVPTASASREGGADRAGEGHRELLVRLDRRVAGDGHRHRAGRRAGRERERARDRREVGRSARGAVRGRVADGDALRRGHGQVDRERGGRRTRVALRHAGIVDGHRGDHGGPLVGADVDGAAAGAGLLAAGQADRARGRMVERSRERARERRRGGTGRREHTRVVDRAAGQRHQVPAGQAREAGRGAGDGPGPLGPRARRVRGDPVVLARVLRGSHLLRRPHDGEGRAALAVDHVVRDLQALRVVLDRRWRSRTWRPGSSCCARSGSGRSRPPSRRRRCGRCGRCWSRTSRARCRPPPSPRARRRRRRAPSR